MWWGVTELLLTCVIACEREVPVFVVLLLLHGMYGRAGF